jgi:restriction system protein
MQPKWYEYAEPLLKWMATQDGSVRLSDIVEKGAELLGLTPDERTETLSSGRLIHKDRVCWALSYLKFAKWAHFPTRAHWAITAEGRTRLESTAPITYAELRQAQAGVAAARGPKTRRLTLADEPSVPISLTPRDRIDGAVNELRELVCADLLEQLSGSNPTFFEIAVLELLQAMGYTGKLGRAEHSGQSGDGGIDGVLFLDRLGLERVHVQAKRWQGSVGQGVVRDFAGAMDVRGATKGVIVTTGTFTRSAAEYVEMSPKVIRLIDGARFVELMVEFAVGVTHEKTVIIPKIDLDYFES